MVSSWDRRIGDVPAASDMNSSVRVAGYEIISLSALPGQRTEVTSIPQANPCSPPHIPLPVYYRRDREGVEKWVSKVFRLAIPAECIHLKGLRLGLHPQCTSPPAITGNRQNSPSYPQIFKFPN